jgi:TM2 domain-containing membrane protein YozV
MFLLLGLQFLWTATARSSNVLMWSVILFVAVSLQGCGYTEHYVAQWMEESDYLVKHEVSSHGRSVLNSCSTEGLKCSGHGYCAPFNADYRSADPLQFCVCETEFADPECGTRRRSQRTAFLLSLFLGVFGVDLFYLGYPVWATMKFLTCGGFGAWWAYDIVRIGSANVYATTYRVAADLPHWIFMLGVVSYFLAVGLFIAVWMYLRNVERKRTDMQSLVAHEDMRHVFNPNKDVDMDQRYRGYGATLPERAYVQGPRFSAG